MNSRSTQSLRKSAIAVSRQFLLLHCALYLEHGRLCFRTTHSCTCIPVPSSELCWEDIGDTKYDRNQHRTHCVGVMAAVSQFNSKKELIKLPFHTILVEVFRSDIS